MPRSAASAGCISRISHWRESAHPPKVALVRFEDEGEIRVNGWFFSTGRYRGTPNPISPQAARNTTRLCRMSRGNQVFAKNIIVATFRLELNGQVKRNFAGSVALQPVIRTIDGIIHQRFVGRTKNGITEAKARGEPTKNFGIGQRIADTRNHRVCPLNIILAVRPRTHPHIQNDWRQAIQTSAYFMLSVITISQPAMKRSSRSSA